MYPARVNNISAGKYPITISVAARTRISHLLEAEPSGLFFRVAVEGGGCSGFQYEFGLKTPEAEDIRIENLVALDPVAVPLVEGSELDFVEELGGSYFVMKNPNAAAKCGCGNSFSV